MKEQAQAAQVIRFEWFEVNLRSGELWKNGEKVKLPEQSFQILAMLLERPGEVVFRREIQKRLWPNDTVVEFENSINAAMKRLRLALGDSADQPRYVETLARRGYRFMCPVDVGAGLAPPPLGGRPPEVDVGAGLVPAQPGHPQGVPLQANLIGKKVSHYRVLEILGGGGMGVVYKAEDLKLGRRVALKFLPEELSSDPAALERFEREARAASALEHPNICPVYEFGEHEGQPFIAMQLLSGQTLRELIATPLTPVPAPQERGWPEGPGQGSYGTALSMERLLDLGIQIAEGLDAAHSSGVIHRDIKPANIFITTRGEAKILDFGLAKLSADSGTGILPVRAADDRPEAHRQDARATASVTPALLLSRSGVAMGTAPYMSPEQVRGEKLDARTDLFSFGLVLYEMATGNAAFSGETVAAIHGAILREPPKPARESNPDLSPKLEEIIGKSLEKDRDLRYQSAGDLRADLRRLKRETDSVRGTPVPALAEPVRPNLQFEHGQDARATLRVLLRRRRFGIGAAALIIMAIFAFLLRPTLPPPRVTDATQITKDGRAEEPMVTDGSRIYFSVFSGNNSSLYQVSATGGEAVPVYISGLSPVLFDISPDRSELLVASCNALDIKDCALWIAPVLGGSPRPVGNIRASAIVSAAAWSPDGKEVAYVQGSSLYRAKTDGTEPRKIVSLATGSTLYWPRWSPDGNRLRFSIGIHQTAAGGIDVNPGSLWEVSADGRNLHQLLYGSNNPADECCGSWTPDGKYFLFQSGRGGTTNIWAIREQESFFRKASHQPVQLTNGPTSARFPVPGMDGKKVFVTTTQLRGELTRYDLASHQFTAYLSGLSATCLNFSRDGQWVTYVAYPEGTLWRSKADGSERVQLTFPPLVVAQPRWSPDGTRIAFCAWQPAKPWNVYLISAKGGSPEQPVLGDHRGSDPTWSPDGNSLLFGRQPVEEARESGTLDLQIVDLRSHTVSKVPGSEELFSPRWSKDGRHILALRRAADGLMLFDVKSQKWTELVRMQAGYPEWTRDGDYIQFLGRPLSGQESNVWRVRISDRKVEQVVGLKDFRQPRNMGIWVALAPDDSPLLLHDTSTQDIYALDVDLP